MKNIAIKILMLLTVVLWGCEETKIVSAEQVLEFSSSNDDATIDGNTATIEASADGGSFVVNITSNQDWVVSTSSGVWFAATQSESSVEVEVPSNSSTSSRSASLTISYGGDISLEIKVNQAAQGESTSDVLPDDPQSILFESQGGEIVIAVDCDEAWSAVSSENWISVSQTEDSFTLYADANSTTTILSAEVKFSWLENGVENSRIIEASQASTLRPMIITVRPGYTAPDDDGNAVEPTYPMTCGLSFLTVDYYENIYNINAIVDWGDGTIEKISYDYPTHTYAEDKDYDISIYGTAESFTANNTDYFPYEYRDRIVAIKQWGNVGVVNLKNAFCNSTSLVSVAAPDEDSFDNLVTAESIFTSCTSLTEVGDGLFDGVDNLTSLLYAFQSCSSLTKMPARIVKDCPQLTTCMRLFWGCPIENVDPEIFKGCTALTAVNQAFYGSAFTELEDCIFDDCVNLTNISYLFGNNYYLKSVPAELFKNNTALTTAFGLFYNCYSLESVSAELFENFDNVTSFLSMFYYCESLKSIPEGIFAHAGSSTTFSSVFKGCASLTEIPADLFSGISASAKTFSNIFESCSGITAIPAGLFDKAVSATTFSTAFKMCTSLKDIPEGLFDNTTAVTTLTSLFESCESITSIPVSIFDNMKSAKTLTKAFYLCSNWEGESPYTMVDGEKVHLYERSSHTDVFTSPTSYVSLFGGCTKLSDYDAISAAYPTMVTE